MSRTHMFLRAVVLVSVLIMPAASVASAQFRALIEAGVNGSTLRGSTNSDFSPIARLSGGAGLVIDITPNLRFQPEVLYVVKGAGARGEPFGNGVLVDATFDLTYLEIPLLLVYEFGSSRIRPLVLAGPSVAMKLNSQIRYRAVSGGPSQTQDDDSVEDRDLGVMFGLGIETEFGSETFLFGVRTSLGFSDARKFNPDRPDNPPLYNTTLGIFAAVVF